jgi:RecB family exonuclease
VSTLGQIESAVAELPPQDQQTLLTWLQRRLPAAPPLPPSRADTLTVFRQLQKEVNLTAARGTAWKQAVADARR